MGSETIPFPLVVSPIDKPNRLTPTTFGRPEALVHFGQIKAAHAVGVPRTCLRQKCRAVFHCLYFEAKLELCGAYVAFFLKIFTFQREATSPVGSALFFEFRMRRSLLPTRDGRLDALTHAGPHLRLGPL
jgi:hypothetical protein